MNYKTHFNKFLKYFVFLILFSSEFSAQTFLYPPKDSVYLKEFFDVAKKENWKEKSKSEIFTLFAKSVIGFDYYAKTLDSLDENKLVTTLSGYDCYTLLENGLALAMTVKDENPTQNKFFENIKTIRYRNGILEDFSSRLHYFSDWMWDLSQRGIINDITKEIGGIKYEKSIYLMSKNPKLYKQLEIDSILIKKIMFFEKIISEREKFYIPEDSLFTYESKINSGDIIGITSVYNGLDITHVGLAIRQEDGRIYFLHAPKVGEKVQISKNTLPEYIKLHKTQTGVMVARILD
jgi:hypothetical protein